mmetsp:Transcript_35545/g.89716  ORF Transcript_35545/g.89716 Transcript_35545/m.89716 type:complete len:92 (-) Transcript_35545:61-336(-)
MSDKSLFTWPSFEHPQVWKQLLQPYQLEVDEAFFSSFIMGRTDSEFLKDLVPGIKEGEIDRLSCRKVPALPLAHMPRFRCSSDVRFISGNW